jgi:PAS domain-containing protein
MAGATLLSRGEEDAGVNVNPQILIEDALPLIVFIAAIVVVFAIPVWEDSPIGRGTQAFIAAALISYVVLMSISILDSVPFVRSHLTPLESSVELLFTPFLLTAVYSVYARQQLIDARRAERSVLQTSEMMGSIVDVTPAGVLVLDASGWITFANDAARSFLELIEEPDTGSLRVPGWSMHIADAAAGADAERSDCAALVGSESRTGVHLVVEWPGGARRRFIANVAPVSADDGTITGAIVAFLESEPWKALSNQG